MIRRIDHIAIVVSDIDEALTFWQEALGLELAHVEEVREQESLVAFLPSGQSEVELVRPTSPTSGVARYLSKRGPGMHHICFEVDDITATLARLKSKGIALIDETPKIGTGGKKIAFIHPRSTGGVLVELYELTPEEPARRLEQLNELGRRLRVESEAAAAGLRTFVNTLLARPAPAPTLTLPAAPAPGRAQEQGGSANGAANAPAGEVARGPANPLSPPLTPGDVAGERD